MGKNLVFDQVLAFLAGALVPLVPALGSNSSLTILFFTALLGGVTGLRLYRNTTYGDNQAEKRTQRLVTASNAALLPDHPAVPAPSVSGPIR